MHLGRTSLATSISSATAGMTLADINAFAQLVAFIVAIVSGLFAINYYWY